MNLLKLMVVIQLMQFIEFNKQSVKDHQIFICSSIVCFLVQEQLEEYSSKYFKEIIYDKVFE